MSRRGRPPQPRDGRLHHDIGIIGSRLGIEAHMTTGNAVIAWQHNLEQALEQARQQHKDVLLDFSAAPM
jgi:cell division ATPase FtsA